MHLKHDWCGFPVDYLHGDEIRHILKIYFKTRKNLGSKAEKNKKDIISRIVKLGTFASYCSICKEIRLEDTRPFSEEELIKLKKYVMKME